MDYIPPSSTLSSEQNTLIFLHLMKTGGRTLVNILKQNINDDARFHYGRRPGERLDDLMQLSDAEKRSLRLIYGHFQFGIHQHLPQSCQYMTLLRHPVERVMSHYYYALANPKHYTHALVQEKTMSLTDYVTHGITDLNNGQTRCIAGNYSSRVAFGETSEALLEKARENLDNHFLLVGTTERFDEFLLLLKHQLGLNKVLYTHSNVNSSRPKRDAISKEEIALITHYNQLDLELYDYATELFQKQVDAAQPELQFELELLKQFNVQYLDVQKKIEKVKKKLLKSRRILSRVRQNKNRIQADLDHHRHDVNTLMNSFGGKLWQQWVRLKEERWKP